MVEERGKLVVNNIISSAPLSRLLAASECGQLTTHIATCQHNSLPHQPSDFDDTHLKAVFLPRNVAFCRLPEFHFLHEVVVIHWHLYEHIFFQSLGRRCRTRAINASMQESAHVRTIRPPIREDDDISLGEGYQRERKCTLVTLVTLALYLRESEYVEV